MNLYDKNFISKKAAEGGFNRDTYEKVLRLIDVLDSYYFTYSNSGGNKDNIKFDINYVM